MNQDDRTASSRSFSTQSTQSGHCMLRPVRRSGMRCAPFTSPTASVTIPWHPRY